MRVLLLYAFVLLASDAAAQSTASTCPTPCVNPTGWAFLPSPDHAALTGYKMGYFSAPDSDAQGQPIQQPIQLEDIGLPTCSLNPLVECSGIFRSLPSKPNVGVSPAYYARVRPFGPPPFQPSGGDWSPPSDPFYLGSLQLRATGKPRLELRP